MKKGKGERKKVYAAKRFARGAMVCPSCQYVLEESSEKCGKCGFSGQVAVEKFPFPAPPLAPVVDPSNFLSGAEKSSISKKVAKLQKRLPQVRFLNCLVALGDEVNLREFGFWLLNAGQMKEGEGAKNFAVLFLIDPKERAMSVTVGYGLDPLVMDTEWVPICEGSRDLLYRQKYGEGIELFLNGAFDLLAERALALQKEVKK
ncbi:MAG: TPM domain-containing protein [Roseibacillus sp.]